MDMNYLLSLIPQLMEGLKVTIKLFTLTILLSIPLGLLLSLGRISRFKIIRWLMGGYVWLFRGTPLMLQLFFIYFGLPFIKFPFFGGTFSFVLSSFTAATVAFVLNYSAYFAEIFRGGIQSIGKGQYDAAKALGLNPRQTMFHVVLPQMVRSVIPAVSNETITLVKDTALASSIALIDLLKKAQQAVSRDADVSAYLLVAIFYLCITLILTTILNRMEKKFNIPCQ